MTTSHSTARRTHLSRDIKLIKKTSHVTERRTHLSLRSAESLFLGCLEAADRPGWCWTSLGLWAECWLAANIGQICSTQATHKHAHESQSCCRCWAGSQHASSIHAYVRNSVLLRTQGRLAACKQQACVRTIQSCCRRRFAACKQLTRMHINSVLQRTQGRFAACKQLTCKRTQFSLAADTDQVRSMQAAHMHAHATQPVLPEAFMCTSRRCSSTHSRSHAQEGVAPGPSDDMKSIKNAKQEVH